MIAYTFDGTTPLPPEVDHDAIAILARCRGKDAVKEAESALPVLDSLIKGSFRNLTGLKSIRTAFNGVKDLLDRRRIYAARIAALRRALGMPSTKIPDTPQLPHLATMADHETRPGDLARHIAQQIEINKKSLAEVERNIATWEGIAKDDERYSKEVMSLEPLVLPSREERQRLGRAGETAHAIKAVGRQRLWSPDAVLERLVKFATERREIVGRIAALEADAAASTALVARKVQSAIDQAGGPAAVTLAAVGADAMSNLADPSNVRELLAQQAEAEAALRRLTSAGVEKGSAAEMVRTKLADIGRQLTTAAKDTADRRRATMAAIIERASAGEEAARARLELLATQVPLAFPTGFAGAIAAARWDISAFGEIVSTLPQ